MQKFIAQHELLKSNHERMLCYSLWNKRDTPNTVTLVRIPSVKCAFKVLVTYRGKIEDVTELFARVGRQRYMDKHNVLISRVLGLNHRHDIVGGFFEGLKPNADTLMKLPAVQHIQEI